MKIELRTVPDKGRKFGDDFEYPRVVGFVNPDTGSCERLADLPYHMADEEGEERALELPPGLGDRFLGALNDMTRSRHPGFTCHTFARALTGGPTPYDPAIYALTRQGFATVPDMRLGLGAVGIIGSSTGLRAFHSLVGLGPESAESLQVLSAGGELTVVETSKVVESYRKDCPTSELYLYEPAQAATS